MFFEIILVLVAISGSFSDCPQGGIKESGVVALQQILSISRHNTWRSMIANGRVAGQPKSSNMKKMKWDAALAKPAQNITNTCAFAHVSVTDSRWPNVGQNLFKSSSTSWTPGPNWGQAVDAWFNEVKDFTYPNKTAARKVTRHYTQVVWASSNMVGCGYTAWYDNSTKWYHKFYACNYGPAGNYVGQAPYSTGAGCESLC